MSVDITTFKQLLRQNRLKTTESRMLIVRTLSRYSHPIGINTLINVLSRAVDRATIYRNINKLEEIGIINKVYTGWKYKIELSEAFQEHHHHISCQNCGMITSIKLSSSAEDDIIRAGQNAGFTVNTHEVELTGLCNSCK